MARRVVVGDLRVQQIERRDGRRSWTIVWLKGTEHAEADRLLRRHEGSGTQRTYAYVLVDHLRWLERDCLTLDAVGLRDLERYMGVLGAEVRMPLGEPWRVGKRLYGPAALSITASCLKCFYLHQAALGIDPELGQSLNQTRLHRTTSSGSPRKTTRSKNACASSAPTNAHSTNDPKPPDPTCGSRTSVSPSSRSNSPTGARDDRGLHKQKRRRRGVTIVAAQPLR